jgi:hypothetical protein
MLKLSRVMADILNFRSANDFTSLVQDHPMIILTKIFKISPNQNTLWALAAMLDFRLAPKTKLLYMTIQ